MKTSRTRSATGCLVLAAWIACLSQWPWHRIIADVVHAVPMILIGAVVVPVCAGAFVFSVMSISTGPR